MAVTIQLRRDTAANWTSENPILAEGELGFETNTKLYKIGDGVSNWTTLTYSVLRSIDEATIVNFENQAIPVAPDPGTLNVFARSLGGRMMLRQQGPSGLSTPLQPSFFQNNIFIVSSSVTTSVTTIGGAVTSTGTISHPATTEFYGYMTNFATAATANATSGTGDNLARWMLGTTPDMANGFFYSARLAFPDATYTQSGASTGFRFFAGFTDQTLAVSVGSDNPAGNRIGFSYVNVNGGLLDTDFYFTTRNGTTESRVSTGCPFTPQNIYDFYIFCPPYPNGVIYYRIDNITNNTTFEGSTSSTLPLGTVIMRGGFQLSKVAAITSNIRMQRLYIESDR